MSDYCILGAEGPTETLVGGWLLCPRGSKPGAMGEGTILGFLIKSTLPGSSVLRSQEANCT